MTSIKDLTNDKHRFRNDPAKLVEVTNLLGNRLREVGRYEEAIAEHRQAVAVSAKVRTTKVSSARACEAISRRALGECLSEAGRHVEAKAEHDRYLSLALATGDHIETQRAHATIGRTFLLWAQDLDTRSTRDRTLRSLLFKSAASFKKALELCESLMSSGKLKTREYADMKSRLLLNLGLVYENLSDFDKCKKLLLDSIQITKSNFLYDELYRCQISLGSIYEKINLLNEALQSYTDALATAKLLKSRTRKCDALLCLGLATIKQESVDQGRRYFKRAYLLRSPVDDDQQKAARLVRVATVIRDDLHQLAKCNGDDEERAIALTDRIGDHFVELKCYSVAVKYYQEELYRARRLGKSDAALAKIYVSIGQTYSDEGRWQEAIDCFLKEYDLNAEANTHERCVSLLNIAELQERALEATDELEHEQRTELKAEIVRTYNRTLGLFDSTSSSTSSSSTSVNESDPNRPVSHAKERKCHVQAIRSALDFLRAHNLDPDRQKELQIELSAQQSSADLSCGHDGGGDEEEDDDDDEEEEDDKGSNQADDPYDSYNLDLLSSASENSDADEGGGNDEEIPDNFRQQSNTNNTTTGKRNPNAAKLNRVNQFGESPLHTACIAGNLAQVERLLEQRAPLNVKDFCGWTPLHEACNHGHAEVVEALLKAGACVQVCDDRSERITPLHDACNCGHLTIVQLLLRFGADVTAVNAKGETPVECLAEWRNRAELDHDLSEEKAERCAAIERQLLAAMKDRAVDMTALQHKLMRGDSQASQSSGRGRSVKGDTSGTLPLVSRRRNLLGGELYLDTLGGGDRPLKEDSNKAPDYDDPRTAREQYASTINKLRRTHLPAHRLGKLDLRPKDREALVTESEVAPRDDWLIDDLGQNKGKPKRIREEHTHNEYRDQRKKIKSIATATTTTTVNRRSPKQPQSKQSTTSESSYFDGATNDAKHDQSVICLESEASSELDNEWNESSLTRSPSLSPPLHTITTTIESAYDFNTDYPKKRPVKSALPICSLEQSAPSVSDRRAIEASRREDAIETSGGEEGITSRMAIVQFDDRTKSSFAIPIPSLNNNETDFTFEHLCEQLVDRYFREYAMKPVVSLYTVEGAILSATDSVVQLMRAHRSSSSPGRTHHFQARIESWTVAPAQHRYTELCGVVGVRPYDSLLDALASLRISHTLDLSNALVRTAPNKHTIAMFQSLFRQNIKELNLSCTSVLSMHKATVDCCFEALSTLSKLQVLNLSCTALPSQCFLRLLNLGPELRHLDLSFNSFGDQHAYTLTQLVAMYNELQCLNLSACDFTDRLLQNKPLLLAIQNSKLVSIQLDYNQIDHSLVTKLKSLNRDKTVVKDLLAGL